MLVMPELSPTFCLFQARARLKKTCNSGSRNEDGRIDQGIKTRLHEPKFQNYVKILNYNI